MTIKEASKQYHIPVKILKEYESWELCGAVKNVMANRQYDEQDIERLGLIMTLYDVGFSSSEVETYMRLLVEGEHTRQQRMEMLSKKEGKPLMKFTLKKNR